MIGGASGFAIQWPVALLAMRVNGAGYSGTEPRWDPEFASFSALTEGLPFGFAFATIAYLLLFASFPPRISARVIPILFLGNLCGSDLSDCAVGGVG